MAKWKPYKLKKEKTPVQVRPPAYTRPPQPDEQLTGFIGSMAASDIEERSARALSTLKTGMAFRTQFLGTNPPFVIYGSSGRNQLNSVEADFFGQVSGLLLGVQVDGEFAHKTSAQREHDKIQDTKLTEALRQLGGGYVVRVPFYYLGTQEQADQTWRELLAGRREFA